MFNNMFRALDNTWRYKFYMGMQNDMNLEMTEFFIHTLKSKLPHMFVPGSHTFMPTHT